uniref:Uncharacterized protein n=1 Tax=Rhizophora mucronata TaxID=61149 RepID=A0A2P2IUX9_RHIMU
MLYGSWMSLLMDLKKYKRIVILWAYHK